MVDFVLCKSRGGNSLKVHVMGEAGLTAAARLCENTNGEVHSKMLGSTTGSENTKAPAGGYSFMVDHNGFTFFLKKDSHCFYY